MRISIMILLPVVGVLIIAGGLFIILNQQTEPTLLNNEGYRDINILELKEKMDNKDVLLINVHIPYDGEIEGTDLFIPFNDILNYLNILPKDKATEIIIYCRSGSMSATASKELVEIGYTNVLNLEGGMNDWKANGFTLINT